MSDTPRTDALIDELLCGDGIPRCMEWTRLEHLARTLERECHKSFSEIPLDGVTRVEVIDSAGRSYVKYHQHIKVTASMQDQGRTLKLFIDCAQPSEQSKPVQEK